MIVQCYIYAQGRIQDLLRGESGRKAPRKIFPLLSFSGGDFSPPPEKAQGRGTYPFLPPVSALVYAYSYFGTFRRPDQFKWHMHPYRICMMIKSALPMPMKDPLPCKTGYPSIMYHRYVIYISSLAAS